MGQYHILISIMIDLPFREVDIVTIVTMYMTDSGIPNPVHRYSDTHSNCVRPVLRNSHETDTFVGCCLDSGTNDGPLSTARLTRPYGLEKYSDEIFYLCDYTSVRIIDLVTESLQTLPHQTQFTGLFNSVIQPSGDLLISAGHGSRIASNRSDCTHLVLAKPTKNEKMVIASQSFWFVLLLFYSPLC